MTLLEKLKIINIKDRGNLKSEYVILKVLEDTNLQHYGIVDATYTPDGHLSNLHQHFFKFYHYVVAKGDYIHLYTKDGNDEIFNNRAKTTTHCFYWDLDVSVWNNEGDVAVLLGIEGWSEFVVKPNKK